MLNLASYQLNEKESKLKRDFPNQYKMTIEMTLIAEAEMSIWYSTDIDDKNNNALLHAYWAALMTKNIDEQWAKKIFRCSSV